MVVGNWTMASTSFVDALLRIDDFVEFQNVFLRMNHQIGDAGEWSPFDQKRLLPFRPGIPFSMLT
jgi:hypothetical protein